MGSLRDFKRFLRTGRIRTAGLLNRAELARNVGISPTTAGQWLSVLDRSGLVTLLKPWFSNRTKSLVKTPKLHFRDTGLCAFLMGIVSREDLMESPLAGALWESMVCGRVAAFDRLWHRAWQLAFWRDRTKEADFLLQRRAASASPTPSGASILKERTSLPSCVRNWTRPHRAPSSAARPTAIRSRPASKRSRWPTSRPCSKRHSREFMSLRNARCVCKPDD